MTWKKEYNQKRQAYLNQKQRQRRQKIKEQNIKQAQAQLNKYYQAQNIKILISFKEYTELNQQKHKLWLDFNWTLKDCAEDIKDGLGNIESIMKLREVADNLIRDYWATAKSEIKRGKSWNLLDYDQQQRLIKYWGYEKARIESGYIDTAERLAREGQQYEKEIELAKFHEQRGKKGCECYACEEREQIRSKVAAEREKVFDYYEQEQRTKDKDIEKEECPFCGKLVKKLDPETGACKKCSQDYG